MAIEYNPVSLAYMQNHPERLRHREGDATCDECGVLGGGTLELNEAIQVGIDHSNEKPDHRILVVEVICLMM